MYVLRVGDAHKYYAVRVREDVVLVQATYYTLGCMHILLQLYAKVSKYLEVSCAQSAWYHMYTLAL